MTLAVHALVKFLGCQVADLFKIDIEDRNFSKLTGTKNESPDPTCCLA